MVLREINRADLYRLGTAVRNIADKGKRCRGTFKNRNVV